MAFSEAELRCPVVTGTGFLLKHLRRSSNQAQDDDLDMLTELDMRPSSAKSSRQSSSSSVSTEQSLPAVDAEDIMEQSMFEFSAPVAPTARRTLRPRGRYA